MNCPQEPTTDMTEPIYCKYTKYRPSTTDAMKVAIALNPDWEPLAEELDRLVEFEKKLNGIDLTPRQKGSLVKRLFDHGFRKKVNEGNFWDCYHDASIPSLVVTDGVIMALTSDTTQIGDILGAFEAMCQNECIDKYSKDAIRVTYRVLNWFCGRKVPDFMKITF